jgi:hypothetical protein
VRLPPLLREVSSREFEGTYLLTLIFYMWLHLYVVYVVGCVFPLQVTVIPSIENCLVLVKEKGCRIASAFVNVYSAGAQTNTVSNSEYHHIPTLGPGSCFWSGLGGEPAAHEKYLRYKGNHSLNYSEHTTVTAN